MKLLTKKSRGFFSLVLIGSALLILLGLAIDKGQPNTTEFWKTVATVFQLVGIAIIILAGILLDMVQVTFVDLYHVLQQSVRDTEKMATAMEGLVIKRVKFLQMTMWEKIAYIFFLFNGVGFIIVAIYDFLGTMPTMRIPSANGGHTMVPHWASASFTILIAVVCLLLAHVVRTRFTDKWEERFKILLREVEDDMGNLPIH